LQGVIAGRLFKSSNYSIHSVLSAHRLCSSLQIDLFPQSL